MDTLIYHILQSTFIFIMNSPHYEIMFYSKLLIGHKCNVTYMKM